MDYVGARYYSTEESTRRRLHELDRIVLLGKFFVLAGETPENILQPIVQPRLLSLPSGTMICNLPASDFRLYFLRSGL
jgi:hypothetical protein